MTVLNLSEKPLGKTLRSTKREKNQNECSSSKSLGEKSIVLIYNVNFSYLSIIL